MLLAHYLGVHSKMEEVVPSRRVPLVFSVWSLRLRLGLWHARDLFSLGTTKPALFLVASEENSELERRGGDL